VLIKNLHRWDITPKEAVEIQIKLQRKIRLNSSTREVHLVAGADASFSKAEGLVHGAVSILSFPNLELVERKTATLRLSFPYIPGLLTFREGPVLLECFKGIKNTPDVVLFDGQGVAHPRRMGIATHLGILLDRPSIGCAKTPLYGGFRLPANSKGAYEYVKDEEGDVIGACLRTRPGVKPVFVSVGNRIDLLTAIDIVLRCTKRYRIPEPLRDAHRWTKVNARIGVKGC